MKSIVFLFLKSFIFLSILYLIGYFLVFPVSSINKIELMKWVFLPTTFLSTILLLFHILISKRVVITNNFSSKQEGVLYKEVNFKELSDKIQNKTNWKLIHIDGGKLIFKSRFDSFKSFGELIVISKTQNKTNISSKPLFWTTLFDMGKNFQNVEQIKTFAHIQD